MERWASNTLRVLGIIVTSILMLVGSLFLLLLSLCSWGGGLEGGGGHKDQAIGYLIGLVIFIALAIFVIIKLAKGIAHNTVPASIDTPIDGSIVPSEVPIHTSPASEQAIRLLIYAIAAGMAFSFFHTFWNIVVYRTTLLPYTRVALPVSIVSVLLYEAPYAVLLVVLARSKPDTRAFAYAFAIPTVLIIQTLYMLPSSLSWQMPLSFAFVGMALMFECLILWLAWQANQHLRYRHEASSLLVAGVVVFVYFAALRNIVVSALYRFLWR